jgi:hypothetical protein
MECRFNPDLRHQHQNSSIRDVQRRALNERRDSFGDSWTVAQRARLLRAGLIGVTFAGMLTLIETQMRKGYAELTFRCSDDAIREARLVDQDPAFVGVHNMKWHRALERWSNSPENEPTIYELQRAVRQGDVTPPRASAVAP